jgi:hypothetical protein
MTDGYARLCQSWQEAWLRDGHFLGQIRVDRELGRISCLVVGDARHAAIVPSGADSVRFGHFQTHGCITAACKILNGLHGEDHFLVGKLSGLLKLSQDVGAVQTNAQAVFARLKRNLGAIG